MSKILPSQVKPLALMKADPFMAEQLDRLQALSMAQLIDEHQRLWGQPPRVKHRAYIWKRCARKIQELRHGGLSRKAQERLEELIAHLGIDFTEPTSGAADANLKVTRDAGMPSPGTSLVREWRGQRIVVRVLDEGFEHDGTRYRSLSAVSKAVTGQHINGRAWFGLTKTGARS